MTYDYPDVAWERYCEWQDALYDTEIKDMHCLDCINCMPSDGLYLFCTRYQDFVAEEDTEGYCEKTMLNNCHTCPALEWMDNKDCNAYCTYYGEFIDSNEYVSEVGCEHFSSC